ncbi:MarC family protein [Edwardsiella piscicida]|nr:MarC family protein [Edwardsiella piscicida]ELM3730079.1 MarC family protein [Edwardsiella piscicida]ELV7537816.1 MarC family protein [Edwardsiella piscicida]
METWLIHFLLTYVTFLSMFCPPATITAATILLGQTPPHTLRQLAWKVALEYVAVMLVAIWIGNYLLMALGLNAHALTATGGAALLFQGWPLMTKGTKAEPARMVVTPDTRPNVQDMVLVPLLFPLTIGGGTIAVGISLASHDGSLAGLLQLSAVILLMAPTIALTFLAVGPLHGRLSSGAIDAMARIAGIVLVTLSLQLLASGLTQLVLQYGLAK